jgi:hypothetical protein
MADSIWVRRRAWIEEVKFLTKRVRGLTKRVRGGEMLSGGDKRVFEGTEESRQGFVVAGVADQPTILPSGNLTAAR